MGGFIETAWRCVKWIGNCIFNVVSWWGVFMEGVNAITHAFLLVKRRKIESADNPKAVGEIAAIGKEKNQLEQKANDLRRNLSNHDKNILDDLLENNSY